MPGFIVVLISAAISVGLVLLVATRGTGHERSPAENAPGSYPDRVCITRKSIAVLPFENLSSDDKKTAYFAEGIQDEILTKLADDWRT